jgi:aminoglycoside phosphotransferase (APT) family kinase protein
VAVLAAIHAIPDPAAAFPVLRPPAGADALRHHVDQQRAYYRWALADDGIEVPIIERSLAWLELHWPSGSGPDVLSWGDARIGNIIYQGFEPAAVLDWEMAALGPRELDVSWLVFLHRFFQDLAESFGAAGLPGFLRRSRVERCYQELSGVPIPLDEYPVRQVPAAAARIRFGVTDHLARARLAGEEGWGMLEHASIGRHDPSGFADGSAVIA